MDAEHLWKHLEKVVNQASNLQKQTSPLAGPSRTQETIRRTLSSLGRRGTNIAASFLSTVLPEVGSKSAPTIELTEAIPTRTKDTSQRHSKGKQKMATTTVKTKRVRVQNTPEVTEAFPVTSPKVIRTRGSQNIKKITTQSHRQLLPQVRFLKSFLDTNYSFRVLTLRPGFTGPVLRQESPGALGFWVSSIFVELYASYCWEQPSSSSPGNIFLSLGLKFRFGLVW